MAIAEKISAMETADFFTKRAALANSAAADAAWAKVGNSAAGADDVWPAGNNAKDH